MNASRIHVGGLPQDARESDLEHFFRGYGRIRQILIKNGFGYVEFADQRDAADAVFEMHGKYLLGREVSVQRARETNRVGRDKTSSRVSRQNEEHEKYRVIVENLSTRVQWQELIEIMSRFGKVDFAKAHNLRPNEGMVQFANYYGMKRAIDNMDRTELEGRRIRLISKEERQPRERSRSPIRRPRQNFRPKFENSFKRLHKERDQVSSNFRKDSNIKSEQKIKPKKNLNEDAAKISQSPEVCKTAEHQEEQINKNEKLREASIERLLLREESPEKSECWSNFKRSSGNEPATKASPSN